MDYPIFCFGTYQEITLLHMCDGNDLLVSDQQVFVGSSGSEPDVITKTPTKQNHKYHIHVVILIGKPLLYQKIILGVLGFLDFPMNSGLTVIPERCSIEPIHTFDNTTTPIGVYSLHFATRAPVRSASSWLWLQLP